MSNLLKILLLILTIFIIIFIINVFLTIITDNSDDLNSGTLFIIREFDFPLEWRNEVEYAEVTKEELNQYPTLKKTINGEDCTKYDKNLWRCKVDIDEWSRTKNFINNKEDIDTCIKVGEKCYSIDFVVCCTDNIEIESIVPLCPCDDGENETNVMVITTMQNNQNLSTDMLTLSINIKNSLNITVSNIDSKTKFYIKDNSSLSSFATMDIPGSDTYEINVQIFEKDKIIVQRSVYVNINSTENKVNKVTDTEQLSIKL